MAEESGAEKSIEMWKIKRARQLARALPSTAGVARLACARVPPLRLS